MINKIKNIFRSRRDKQVLIGIPIKNCGHFLQSLGEQLCQIEYPSSCIDIVLLLGDSFDDSNAFAEKLVGRLKREGFRNVVLTHLRLGFQLPHQERHENSIQQQRLRGLSISRQFIIDNYLVDNDYVWWVDADFELIPADALRRLVDYKKDFVIPNLRLSNDTLYDLGSRRENRTIDEISGSDLVELDVGSAHAFISARIFSEVDYLTYPSDDVRVTKEMMLGKNLFQEGDILSIRARAAGFKLYASKFVVLRHAEVVGTSPMAVDGVLVPRNYRAMRIHWLYGNILGRVPDGIGYWGYYNSMLTLQEIEDDMVNSEEAKQIKRSMNLVAHEECTINERDR